MIGLHVENIYVNFRDQVFQLSVGIPMGVNCAPLLTNLFLYSYEAEFFFKKLLQYKTKELVVSFNNTSDISVIFTIMSTWYIPMNSIKDNTESDISASFLDIVLNTT
jgi:hypothetical protein